MIYCRLASSLKQNLTYYLSIAAAGLVGIGLLLISGRLHAGDLLPLAMLLANTYGKSWSSHCFVHALTPTKSDLRTSLHYFLGIPLMHGIHMIAGCCIFATRQLWGCGRSCRGHAASGFWPGAHTAYNAAGGRPSITPTLCSLQVSSYTRCAVIIVEHAPHSASSTTASHCLDCRLQYFNVFEYIRLLMVHACDIGSGGLLRSWRLRFWR
jgi:hypothetical protein